MLTRHDEQMSRVDWLNVHERRAHFIAVNDTRGELTGENTAEDAIAHRVHLAGGSEKQQQRYDEHEQENADSSQYPNSAAVNDTFAARAVQEINRERKVYKNCSADAGSVAAKRDGRRHMWDKHIQQQC